MANEQEQSISQTIQELSRELNDVGSTLPPLKLTPSTPEQSVSAGAAIERYAKFMSEEVAPKLAKKTGKSEH